MQKCNCLLLFCNSDKLSKSNTLPSDQHDYKFLFRHIVSKERAIGNNLGLNNRHIIRVICLFFLYAAFSDGVFSIVATLLILDIAYVQSYIKYCFTIAAF